jgi:hypothetical protein
MRYARMLVFSLLVLACSGMAAWPAVAWQSDLTPGTLDLGGLDVGRHDVDGTAACRKSPSRAQQLDHGPRRRAKSGRAGWNSYRHRHQGCQWHLDLG